MPNKAIKHIILTLFSKLITVVVLVLPLVISAACTKLVGRYNVKEKAPHRPETSNDISRHPIPLDNGSIINEIYENGKFTFLLAVETGDEPAVKLFMNDPNCDVNARCKRGKTFLYIALEQGHEGIAKLLINDQRVDINKTTDDKNGPIHIATRLNRIESVKELLKTKHILPNERNHHGENALYIALQKGHREIAELLLKDERTTYEEVCSICLDIIVRDKNILCITICGHSFHKECIQLWKDNQKDNKKTCPDCRQGIL